MSLRVLTQGGGGSGGASASIFVAGLSETDAVTATKDGKTVQGKWTVIPNPAYGLPEGYTRLKSIEATGTQYLDLGISVPHAQSEVYVKFSTAYPAQDAPITGHAYGTWGWNTNMLYFNINGAFYVNAGHTNISAAANTVYEVTYTSTSWEINGAEGTSNASNYADGYNDTVFYGNGRCGKGVLEAYTLRNNGEAVRNLIPARRNSDGAVGAYDTVTNAFFGNAGTGEFIAGEESDVPKYIYGHEITIKSYGTWTVTATNGEETISQDVLVDAAVEYEIKMAFALYLYRDGTDVTEVTGGWEAVYDPGTYYGHGTFAQTEDALTVSTTGRQYVTGVTKKVIDVTEYKTAVFYVDACSSTGWKSVGCYQREGVYNVSGRRHDIVNTGEVLGEVTVDISDLNGGYYFVIACSSEGVTASPSALFHVSEVYLEK